MPRSKVKPNEARKHAFTVRFSDDELKIVNAYLDMKDIRIKRRFFRECIMNAITNDFMKDEYPKDKKLALRRFGKFPPGEREKTTDYTTK